MIDLSVRNVVKICGVMDSAAAITATRAGADLLGFIFAESRRKVTAELVRSVRRSLPDHGEPSPKLVGVTVNLDAIHLERLIQEAELDIIQLSGDETPDLLDQLPVPIIKTFHIREGIDAESLMRVVDPWFDHPQPVISIHIDAGLPGVYGGTGTQPDWSVAAMLAERYPAILAGGLNPGNVAEGVRDVRPIGVDVSSGVEIGGVKDSALIEAFVVRARQALQDVGTEEV
jgi:phosphoribosylanthranilate isomerase